MVVAAMGIGCDEEMTETDAGGGGGTDAGGAMDGGGEDASVAAVDCTMAVADEWWTPPDDLPAFDESQRGVVIGCGVDDPLDAATVDERARMPLGAEPGEQGVYDGPTLTEGAAVTRVLYRSERTNGDGGFGSGTLYLPAGASDMPLIVHVSGTTGLADICAPSRGRFKDLEKTLYVLIGNGNAVFVPDLMGLGTPGSMAYLEATDAGHSVLDGARAALAAAPEGALNGDLLLSGHSAGGHAVLSAQALQREYAPELSVLGVAALAGLWFDTEVFSELLTAPGYSTAGDDGWNVVYGAMYFIGHAAAYDGDDMAYGVIHPDRRDGIREAYEGYCTFPVEDGMMDLRQALAAHAATAGQVFDPGFQSDFVNRFWCDAGMLDRCPDRVLTWIDRFAADRPTLDPDGAPIWFHIGSDDARITPNSMRCPILEAEHDGVDTQTCYYDGVEHGPTAGVAAPWVSQWAQALGGGGDAPGCPDSTPFPFGDPTSCGITMPADAGAPAGSDAGVDAGMAPSDAGVDGGP